MLLVGFIIRIYHDARSPECQIRTFVLFSIVVNKNLFGIICFQNVVYFFIKIIQNSNKTNSNLCIRNMGAERKYNSETACL